MKTVKHKQAVIDGLRQEILKLQGFKISADEQAVDFGLGELVSAFSSGHFPVSAIHEFIGTTLEDAAATGGFISALLSILMKNDGIALYVSAQRKIFPPALARFGLSPDRVVFIDLSNKKDILWASEEALKCETLSAVVVEIDSLSFAQSRRLQLVVEKSKVSCFVIRRNVDKLSSTTAVARWQVSSVESRAGSALPGIGFPRWQVDLLKVKNGQPGRWIIEYIDGGLSLVEVLVDDIKVLERKVV